MNLLRRKDLAFNATFKRRSPADFAEKVGIPLGWIVVNHGHIPKMADRRKAHGAWFEITSNRAKIYRMLRFSPNIKKGNAAEPGTIVVDWIGWIDLHGRDEDVDGPIALEARRLPWWKRLWAYLKHPDPAVRLSGWLGWASLFLGVFSFLLTLPYEWIATQTNALVAFVAELMKGCSPV